MQVIYQFDFDSLPSGVKKQLAKSTANSDFLVYGETRSDLFVHISNAILVLVCGFFLYVGAAADFGDPVNDAVWAREGLIVWYAILMFGIVYALFSTRQRLVLKKKFHFLPGRYLFSFSLVDARSDKIRVFDLRQMRNLEAVHKAANGAYHKTVFSFNFHDGSRETLTIKNRNLAESVLRTFNLLQNEARAASDNGDTASLYGFDPFLDLRKSNWRGADSRNDSWFKRKVMPWAGSRQALAIVLGLMFWFGRNAASDVEMARNAKQQRTEAAYLGYINQGKFYVDDLKKDLPRVVFEEVRKKRSVSLLRQLKKRFPASDIQPDVTKEIHALHELALKKFQEQAVSSDPSLVASMEQLLRFAESHDNPLVAIKFLRPSPEELNQLDIFLKSKEISLRGMKIIPAAKYFSNDSAAVREARIVGGLRSAFSSIFPNDVLTFAADSTATASKPMLQIAYQIEPSGKIFTSEKDQDAFVGLVVRFRASIVVPDVAEQWKFDLEIQPPESFRVEYKTASTEPEKGPSDSQVYAVMAERAFDTLGTKIKAAFFRPDSSVFMKQVNHGR